MHCTFSYTSKHFTSKETIDIGSKVCKYEQKENVIKWTSCKNGLVHRCQRLKYCSQNCLLLDFVSKIWTYSKESLLFSLSTVMFYLNVSSCTVVLWKRFYTSMVVMVMLKHFLWDVITLLTLTHFINFDSLY